MKLSVAIKAKELDLRLREKLVHEGKLSKKVLTSYLDELSDDAQHSTYTEVESKTKTTTDSETDSDISQSNLEDSSNTSTNSDTNSDTDNSSF